MYLINFMFLVGLILGFVVVASSPSPYFAALGLVVAAGMGCGVLVGSGGSFLSLVLFLIYLGGMMVVFAYSAALVAEPYPEGLGGSEVLSKANFYVFSVFVGGLYFSGEWYETFLVPVDDAEEFSVFQADVGGVSLVYLWGGGMLVATVVTLILALVVVLEIVRGLGRGAVRALS